MLSGNRILPRGQLGKRKDKRTSMPPKQIDENKGATLRKCVNNYLLTVNMKRSILLWYIKDGQPILQKRRVLS